jgi:hypothetical protein
MRRLLLVFSVVAGLGLLTIAPALAETGPRLPPIVVMRYGGSVRYMRRERAQPALLLFFLLFPDRGQKA